MSKKLLIFGSVYSPPIGIFKEDIEISYWNYYRPLLKILYSYPKIPVVLFFTGTLLSWIEENHGEFLDVMAEMVKRRQLEILGGAYYAPMLNLISRQDCIGQIELLTTYIRKHFGRRPRGCWITEQIWEPPMPSIIQSAGINYIFLNEYHFWKAGFEERDFHTPCITEDQGKTLVVFPMAHDVYQHFWDMKPDSIRKKIETADLGRENQVISLIHGIRHDISNSSHTESHLTAVLSELSALINDNKIELILPHQYLRTRRKLSRGYFPPTSYDEMQAYDSISALENYLHHKGTLTSGVGRTGYYYGSLFRQNLSRYPEVNLMYAKMHFVQRLTAHIRGDKYRKQAAREELWHGQTHAPFWHGEHGGVYVNNYRKEVYAALIRSEKITREQGIFAPSIISLDFDMDGLDEFLYQGNQINAYVHSLGGILFELDFIPSPWNFLDTMGRYPEVYHQSNQEAQGYDTYPRRAFVDHFFTPEATIEQFDRMISEDEGMFSTARYEIESENRSMSKKLIIPFIVEGSLKTKNGIRAIRIQKTYSFTRKSARVHYCITNTGDMALQTIFAPEINLSFISDQEKYLRVSSNNNKKSIIPFAPVELDMSSGIVFEDRFTKVKIDVAFAPETECWTLPLKTEHLVRNTWIHTYQGSTILPRWFLSLKPRESHNCNVSINLASRRGMRWDIAQEHPAPTRTRVSQ